MKVIGISGLARAGKDSFFDLCKEELGLRKIKCKRYAFADALKQECDDFLKTNIGISSFTENDSEKKIIRPFLVTYGSEVRRKLDPDCWVKKIGNLISQDTKSEYAFITDARYLNEVQWIHNQGGSSVYINRIGNEAPNEEELKNDPITRKECKHELSWGDFSNLNNVEIKKIANNILKQIL